MSEYDKVEDGEHEAVAAQLAILEVLLDIRDLLGRKSK